MTLLRNTKVLTPLTIDFYWLLWFSTEESHTGLKRVNEDKTAMLGELFLQHDLVKEDVFGSTFLDLYLKIIHKCFCFFSHNVTLYLKIMTLFLSILLLWEYDGLVDPWPVLKSPAFLFWPLKLCDDSSSSQQPKGTDGPYWVWVTRFSPICQQVSSSPSFSSSQGFMLRRFMGNMACWLTLAILSAAVWCLSTLSENQEASRSVSHQMLA